LIIVALVNNQLQIRVFDSDGTYKNTNEVNLPDKVKQIESFKKELKDRNLWPPHELSWNEKGWLSAVVQSIVCRELTF
jgi:hypothetical protein